LDNTTHHAALTDLLTNLAGSVAGAEVGHYADGAVIETTEETMLPVTSHGKNGWVVTGLVRKGRKTVI